MSNTSPAEAGRGVWRASEPWVESTRVIAATPGVLLAELSDWAALLDRHSSVELEPVGHGATRVVWENVPGHEPHARECAFRLGALAGLLGPSPEIRHFRCRDRGDDACAFALEGIEPTSDPEHAALLREVSLVAMALQGRESLFRRMSLLGAGRQPFPDVRDLRGVRRFLEELEDPVLVLDCSLAILDANHAATQVLGMSLDELRGLALRDLLTPDSHDLVHRWLPRLLEVGAVRGLSVESRTRHGSVQLEISARRSETGDTLVLIARDTSEHRRLERELEARNRELQEQNRRIGESDTLKSEFLANVSHELTTPLTSIKGFARLLAGDLAAEAAGREPRLGLDKRMEFVSIVSQETERMTELISGLLELSKIESGVVALDRARVSLAAIVRECLLVLKPRLDERGLKTNSRLEEGSAELDPDRMKQVVLNLLDNAVKFSAPGSEIGVTLLAAGDAVRLAIRNPAPQLEPSDLARMFERFVQRDGSFSRAHGGVGLGLNLVRSIVHLHGGRVWAELGVPGTLDVILEIPR